MSEVTINIYGGSQQILPSATKVVQHFYNGMPFEQTINENIPGNIELSGNEIRLSPYVDDADNLRLYLSQLAGCTTATEFAKVVVGMAEREPKITANEIVKERFIRLLLPLAPNITSGVTIGNLRARINNALAARHNRH